MRSCGSGGSRSFSADLRQSPHRKSNRPVEGGRAMDSLLHVSRRGLIQWGLAAAGLPSVRKAFGLSALAQDASSEGGKKGAVGGRADEELFTGNGLPGGGQLEIRLTQTLYTSDPDQLEVAQRMKPFDLESWITEWTR